MIKGRIALVNFVLDQYNPGTQNPSKLVRVIYINWRHLKIRLYVILQVVNVNVGC